MKTKTRKTRSNQRDTYTYYDAFGKKVVTLRPGENEITEANIKMLHSLDDNEVRNNIKNCKASTSKKKKSDINHQKKDTPLNTNTSDWVLSLNAMGGEEGRYKDYDKSHIAYEASVCVAYDDVDETEEEMRQRILWFLTDLQRKIFCLVKIEGYSQTEVAEMLGTSISNVNKHYKKALERIEQEKAKM